MTSQPEEKTEMDVRSEDEPVMRDMMKAEGRFCDDRTETKTGRIHLSFHRVRLTALIP